MAQGKRQACIEFSRPPCPSRAGEKWGYYIGKYRICQDSALVRVTPVRFHKNRSDSYESERQKKPNSTGVVRRRYAILGSQPRGQAARPVVDEAHLSHGPCGRPELVAVYYRPFLASSLHLARHHLYRHADADFPGVHVGQLCGDHGAFFQMH